ncbi:hypothetical protein, partial [Burkholderia pseudomallei]|uniref:hypothetical protein n=1 Tax=Burkholderia pseudomallei TaxID=28450 RepID=UPI002115FEE3
RGAARLARQWTGRARASRGGRGASNARSRMPVACLPIVSVGREAIVSRSWAIVGDRGAIDGLID